MEDAHILKDLVIVYGLGVLVVYVFQKLRQSNIVGFLATGVLFGPFGLSMIGDTQSVGVLAEIGVMLLLFSLGLELSFKKLMKIRAVVFGTGSVQVLLTTTAVAGAAVLFGLDVRLGIFLGFLAALSSTAIALRLLMERDEIDSIHGRVSLGVLIFQDLCVVPMVVLIPLLAKPGSIWLPLAVAVGKASLVLLAVAVLARFVIPAFLRRMIGTRSKELFVIATLWILLGMAWALSLFGFSLALGAFLAGLTVSESEFSHQIFADIRPFRDGLNSLFFISMGMLVDLGFIWSHAGLVLALIGLVMAGKAILMFLSVCLTRLPFQVGIIVGLSLAQIGEFSFVLLQAGWDQGLVSQEWYQFIMASAVATMIMTPLLFQSAQALLAHSRLASLMRSLGSGASLRELDRASDIMSDHVLICGFGVTGRNIARVLSDNHIAHAILELNSHTVEEERRNGQPIFFGDCTDPGILAHAGIAEARVMVLAISDPFATRRAVKVARELKPDMVILTRNKYLAEIDELYDLGATEVVSEEFESSLELLARILRAYHFPRQMVAQEIKSIRDAHYQVFRHREATVPRLRLSTKLNIYTETFKIHPDSAVLGQRIAQSGLRQATGALILGIIREPETINNPGPDETIREGDLLIMCGTKGQLKKAMEMVAGAAGDGD